MRHKCDQKLVEPECNHNWYMKVCNPSIQQPNENAYILWGLCEHKHKEQLTVQSTPLQKADQRVDILAVEVCESTLTETKALHLKEQ